MKTNKLIPLLNKRHFLTVPIVATAPNFTTSPSINTPVTTTIQGSYINGSFTGTAPVTITQQWKYSGVNISGATAATFTPSASDVGKALTVTVTLTNAIGNTSSTSTAVTVVGAPVFSTNPTIVGTPTELSASSYTNGSFIGTTPITTIQQWKYSGVNISGATAATFTPSSGDAGNSLTVTVTLSNIYGSTSSTSTPVSVSAAGTSPLEPAFTQMAGGSNQWGFDASDGTDQNAFNSSGTEYFEKGARSGSPITYVSNSDANFGFSVGTPMQTILQSLPTVVNNVNTSNGGGTRFGPGVTDGLNCVYKNIQLGDATYHSGLRSGLAFDGTKFAYGVDYWVAYAIKLGSEWSSVSLPSGNIITLWDTHNIAPYSPGFNGTVLSHYFCNIIGGHVQTMNHWMSAVDYNGSGNATGTMLFYNWAANFGGWQRIIHHLRGGSAAQSPIIETWVATGTGAYTKLTPAVDPRLGSARPSNSPWGDPLSGGGSSGYDYLKHEIYTVNGTGGPGSLSIYDSSTFWQQGTNLLANAQAALVPWAK